MRTRLCSVGTDELLCTVRLKNVASARWRPLMRNQRLDGFQFLARLG